MSWFEMLLPPKIKTSGGFGKKDIPEGLWKKCPACSAVLYRAELERNLDVCPKCSHHLRIGARRRLEILLDKSPQEEIAPSLKATDPLKFKDLNKYRDRLADAQKKTDELDGMVVIKGELKGSPVVAAAFEFGFMGGSMGSVVGEKFVRAVNHCIENNLPLVCFSASGGARMQESLFSLMQMAKTSAVLGRMADRGIPFISVMTDPTMGGVSASLAMLGDVNVAEPGALIGFAGPRVIEDTIRQKLPEGFQRAEFLLEHGMIDMISTRQDMRANVARMVEYLAG